MRDGHDQILNHEAQSIEVALFVEGRGGPGEDDPLKPASLEDLFPGSERLKNRIVGGLEAAREDDRRGEDQVEFFSLDPLNHIGRAVARPQDHKRIVVAPSPESGAQVLVGEETQAQPYEERLGGPEIGSFVQIADLELAKSGSRGRSGLGADRLRH